MKSKNIIFFIGLLLIVAVTGLGGLLFYYPTPTYNPFDDVFNVSRDRLIKEGCIEEMIECGFVNVTKDFGDGTSIYYQYFGEENTVYYKGFSINIDTVVILSFEEQEKLSSQEIGKIYYSKEIDIEMLKKKLSKINLQLLSIQKNYDGYEITLTDKNNNRIENLGIGIFLGIRNIHFDYLKPNHKKTLQEHIMTGRIYFRNLFNLDDGVVEIDED